METAILIHPALRGAQSLRSPQARLDEATGLAAAINIAIEHREVMVVHKPLASTLIGGGKIAEIAQRINDADIQPGLVIVDAGLTPVQHRNLEKAWNTKVLDRTALILEIFGARAQTAEGRLQVELAHLSYQRSRLVRSWTHLERQRGGAGFLGGPGERQIESDRRTLDEKIIRLRKKIEDVRRTRTLQRAKRRRAPHPVAALVGYTNAGKSSLFNQLTHARVEAADMLFATLDPTMRAIDLPGGLRLIISDTVGFISELPTELVAAFRATLEEVLEADVIVHVRDIAHADTQAQNDDVLSVLKDLGIDDEDGRPVIEVLNKVDLLDASARADISLLSENASAAVKSRIHTPAKVGVSAITGEGGKTILHDA